MPQFLNTSDADFEARFTALLGAKREDSPDVDAVVADIIADVRAYASMAMQGLIGLDRNVLETAVFPGLDMSSAKPFIL